MSRVKFVLLLSASAGIVSAGAEAAPLISFSLNLPAPRVAVNQALSPSTIAGSLRQRGFRVQEMYRKGPAYSVTAIGPSGNKVLLMVDGRSGAIIGMSVLAAVVPITPQAAPNAVFLDDRHPFGAVVPEVIYDHWDRYTEPQWTEAGPAAIVVKPTYAPYEYAVPHNFVHTSPRTHKSYAIAPPRYRGMQVRNSSGQQIKQAETRADAADKAAAYEAERADQATYDKAQAQEETNKANQRADDLDKENNSLADYGDQQQKRAEDAEERANAAEKQLEEQGKADDPCGSGCEIQPDDNNNTPEQGETPANPDDQKPVEAEPTSPEGNPTEQPAAPEQPASPEEQPAPQEERQAPAQEEQQAPAQEEQQPAPQEEQQAPAQEEQQAPQQEEQAAPQEEPQQQEESQPEDNGGGGGDDGGGGGDDGGGGGDDGGGGGGDDGGQ